MNHRSSIEQILDLAILAPSGDNSQPWRFEVKDNEIRIFNVPERDNSLYNYRQHASLVALGGLIENVKIASPYFGYTPSVNLLPEKPESNLVASISLKESAKFQDPLYPYIKERVSNRKPYETRGVSDTLKQSLLGAANFFDGVSIKFVDDLKNIEALAAAAGVNEKVVLENKKLHEFLFQHITWTKEEDEQRRGFFIKTLELKGPQVAAFRLLRHWAVLKLLNKIGISGFVSRDNAKLYKQSGAFVAVIAHDTSPISFLKSGMLMQRFWLAATKFGLGIQPLTGVLFLYHRIAGIAGDDDKELSPNHSLLVKNVYSKIANIFEADGKPIIVMFRAGYAAKPAARCLRHEPEITFVQSL